jgi:threonine-phosphate decarboxylase
MAEALHGGRLWETARTLDLDPASILDFSANLNPLGPPESALRAIREALPGALTAYPDTPAPRLRARLCARHGAPDDTLVLGAGGAALLFLALRALAPRRVLVPMPCFQEQPRALAACGAELVPFPLRGLRLDLEGLDSALEGCDTVLLTNPHNPTGQLLRRFEFQKWILHRPEVALVVDEAFMDYAPGESLLPELLARPRTVILRSLTKFFAMPALRVGYAFADAATADRMGDLQESWPAGQLELLAAQAALEDVDYEQRSLTLFQAEAPRFRSSLESLGLRVHPSAAPFCLVELPEANGTACGEALLRKGILVRTCARWPGLGDRYLRLALRTRAEVARLLKELDPLIRKA